MASSSETRNHGQDDEEPFTAPPELTELVYIIIDGNRYSRETIKNALYAYGMRNVVEVDDGIAALKVLQNTHIDVILVNYELPRMTGIDFTMRVRRREDVPAPEILLIMLSNSSEKGKIIAARNAGVHEFLAKPFSPQASPHRNLCRSGPPLGKRRFAGRGRAAQRRRPILKCSKRFPFTKNYRGLRPLARAPWAAI